MKSKAESTWGMLDALVVLAMMFSLFVSGATGQTLGAVCPGWSVTNDVRMAIDLNRDGKADLAAFDNPDSFNKSALWAAINNGDGTFSVKKNIADLDPLNVGDPTKHIRTLADLTGRHNPDVVIFGDAGVWTVLAKGDGTYYLPHLFDNFGVQQGWDPSKHVRILADLNHDGYPDIIGFGDDGVWTALGKGDGTFTTPRPAMANQNFGVKQGWSPAKHVRLLADLDNDGFPDIVGFGDQGVWTAMSKRDGTFADAKLVIPTNFGSDQGWTPTKHVRMTAILNNVGFADIIAFGDQGVWTALSNGDGTFQTPKLVLANFGVAQGWDPSKHVRLMADLNHDGKDDIVAFGDAGVWTALSAGHGTFGSAKLTPKPRPQSGSGAVFEPGAGTFETPHLVLQNFGVDQEWSSAKHLRLLADLNGDHFPDIVGFGDRGVWTSLGNGDGTFQTPQFPLDYFACNGRFDFNVETAQTDPNGFPFNPQWRWQVYHPNTGTPNPKTDTSYAAMCHYFTRWSNPSPNEFVPHPSFSDCTDQTNIVNVPDSFPNSSICSAGNNSGFPGHVNWFTATFGTAPGVPGAFSGSLSFGDHSIDDDYDNSLYVAPGYPAMMNGRDSQHVEFDSDETIDNFDTPWWSEFHNTVDNGAASSMLKDTESIVTGMFGVDCEHDDCKSEVHPVFTLAAHVFDNPDNDTWAMFLRNTGDEGYCSSQLVKANFATYTFRLPWRTKESIPWTSVEVLWGPDNTDCTQSQEPQAKSCFEQLEPPGGATGPTITYVTGKWVDVTFTFPGPSDRPLIDGELHLRWSRGGLSNAPLASSAPGSLTQVAPAPNSHPVLEEPDEAGSLRIALHKLSPAQQSQIRREVAAASPRKAKLKVMPRGKPAREVTASEAPAPHPAIRVGEQGAAATEKAARDAAMIRELCKANGGFIQGAPANMCKQSGNHEKDK